MNTTEKQFDASAWWGQKADFLEYVHQADPPFASEIKARLDDVDRLMQKSLARTGDGEYMGEWPLRSLADAFKPRPPVTYLAGELFSLPSLNIVYGAPSTFKTFFLGDLAIAVASGMDWLVPLKGKEQEVQARPTIQVPVLWCDFDNGQRRMDERFEALARARGLSKDAPLRYTSMPLPWLDGSDIVSIDGLILGARARGFKLIIIDNLGVVSGDADENSAAMSHVLANFRRLAEETGAAVILIHHQRKATGFRGRSGENLRGHSSIEAALDLALLVEREEHSDMIMIRGTKTRDVDVLPFGAVFTYEHKEDTTELETARFYGWAVEDVVSDAATERAILEVVEDLPKINKTDLTQHVKGRLPDVGLNRIHNLIGGLVSRGELVVEIGEKNARLHSLPKASVL